MKPAKENAQPGGKSRQRAKSTGRITSTAYSTVPAGIEGILHRLDGVKSTGADSWLAKCPAHDDRSPSLTIKDAGDKVLLYCHAGCIAADIVAAVGLELRDLYYEALPAHARRELAVQASCRDLEAAVDHELLILAQTLGCRVMDRQTPRDRMPSESVPMPAEHWERELLAARRIMWLLPLVYGRELGGRSAS